MAENDPRKRHSQTFRASEGKAQPHPLPCQGSLSLSLVYALDPAANLKEKQRPEIHGECEIIKFQTMEALPVKEPWFFCKYIVRRSKGWRSTAGDEERPKRPIKER